MLNYILNKFRFMQTVETLQHDIVQILCRSSLLTGSLLGENTDPKTSFSAWF